MTLLDAMLAVFPTELINIERKTVYTDDNWYKTKTWADEYVWIKWTFTYIKNFWDEKKLADRLNIEAKYMSRINIRDIWGNENNISEKDRVKIKWINYKIVYVFYENKDHIIIFLDEIR